MIRKIGLYFDSFFNRDKYLSELNSRIFYYKDADSSPSKRVIDDCTETCADTNIHVPEVDVSEFSLDFLKQSMRENGCLIVRNFFSADDVKAMQSFVDYSFAVNSKPDTAVHKYLSKKLDLEPVLKKTRADIQENKKVNSTYSNTAMFGSKLTHLLGQNKSFLIAHTPILAEKLLNLFEKKGLRAILKNYFGNDPCVSVYKWVLRRSGPPDAPIDFHQDGAFMGDQISSLNCWIPLSNCGTGYDVHGLDVVPVRFMNAFKKGSGMLDWTISDKAVTETYSQEAVVTPTFREGDLFFFDHLLVHRSQCLPGFARPRSAIETWFFDSVNFPKNQIPIKW
jgi:hypothetical protein